MALYHLSAKIIARAKGRSIVAAASYRAGERLADERGGRTHDYRRRAGVAHTEILLPIAAPEWMDDREWLWNAVEKSEKRADAQLAREVELSLPRELSPMQRLDLARDFVRREFVARGMVADLAVHCPTAGDGGEQPHAHVLLTLRSVSPDGFGGKERAWNDKALLSSWRERWSEAVNDALDRAGQTARVDHRSNRTRGLDAVPQPKLGPAGHRVRRAAAGGKPVPARYRRRLERAAAHWMDDHARAVGDRYSRPPRRERPIDASTLGDLRTKLSALGAKPASGWSVPKIVAPLKKQAVSAGRGVARAVSQFTEELLHDE